MKKFIVIMLAAFVFCACNDSYNPYEHEIVVNRDCSINGMSFDSDSVRCGKNGSIYFSIAPMDENNPSPYDLFLYFDSTTENVRDSIWILEMNSDRYSVCENLKLDNLDFLGTFCLKNNEIAGRKYIGNPVDFERNIDGEYFIYSKYGAYKAFCNIKSMNCNVTFSCMVQYDGTFNFSRVPNAEEVNLKFVTGCPF
ncbi:hypothetical protein [Fibrobacter succinogenes]|uniref:hypothetical protein n=1 Tax=Fibrobacter succinogenes TaxID=833 RepID=UPI0015698717|nr:hypothetical protein [Fibrobacter succinogenes]MBR6942878.1 hypothetical protein [Fibrobacter sp.]